MSNRLKPPPMWQIWFFAVAALFWLVKTLIFDWGSASRWLLVINLLVAVSCAALAVSGLRQRRRADTEL